MPPVLWRMASGRNRGMLMYSGMNYRPNPHHGLAIEHLLQTLEHLRVCALVVGISVLLAVPQTDGRDVNPLVFENDLVLEAWLLL